jgi:hypothetical protein
MKKQIEEIKETTCVFCGKIFKSRTDTKICFRCYLKGEEDIEQSINISNVISEIIRASANNEKT